MITPVLQLGLIDVVLIVAYLIVLVGTGVWFKRRAARNVEGYFLGGRNLPGWMLGLSGAAANIDVAGTLVVISWLFILGLNGFWILTSGHVPIMMAVIVVLIGKWIRRSRVVTSNEYMELRFGSTASGQLARTISTFGQLLGLLTALTYFLLGTGKFFAPYLPLDLPSEGLALVAGEAVPFWTKETVAALIVIGIGLAYSLVSGYAGVVGADVVQITVIFVAFVVLIVTAMVTVTPELIGSIAAENPGWLNTLPPVHFDTSSYGNRYNGFEAMALVCGFFIVKNSILGFSAVQGYTAQRWLSCKDDRDAGVMGAVWMGTLVFRWAMVMAVALLGWVIVRQLGDDPVAAVLRSDPERVFPYVLSGFLHPGWLGIVFAGLLAASLSTVVSLLNAGASFLVRDVYQRWLRPNATSRETMIASYTSVLLLVAAAVLFSKTFRNVNDIWTWLMAGWGGAKFVPMLMFWYWHRGNGTGFAVGSMCGLVAALAQRFYFPEASPMFQFAFSSIPSAVGFLVASHLSRPVAPDVLENFYQRIRPWGFWGPVKAKFTAESQIAIKQEHRRDVQAVVLAVPALLTLYLLPLLFMTRQWGRFTIVAALFGLFAIGLYRVWFRWLGKEGGEPVYRDDAGDGPRGGSLSAGELTSARGRANPAAGA